jgi:hypothetical protein
MSSTISVLTECIQTRTRRRPRPRPRRPPTAFVGGAVVLFMRTRLTETQNVVLVDAVLNF